MIIMLRKRVFPLAMVILIAGAVFGVMHERGDGEGFDFDTGRASLEFDREQMGEPVVEEHPASHAENIDGEVELYGVGEENNLEDVNSVRYLFSSFGANSLYEDSPSHTMLVEVKNIHDEDEMFAAHYDFMPGLEEEPHEESWVRILNSEKEKFWTQTGTPPDEAYKGDMRDEIMGDFISQLDYIDRWDGEDEVVVYDSGRIRHHIYDIEFNPDLDKDDFVPANQHELEYAEDHEAPLMGEDYDEKVREATEEWIEDGGLDDTNLEWGGD